jgi:hypothetical protein
MSFAVCHSFQTVSTGMMLGLVTGFLCGVFLASFVHR